VLNIEANYSLVAAVASQNWIGHFEAQDEDVPIIKVWDLLEKIKELRSLRGASDWLVSRKYLPTEGKDYAVVPVQFSCGEWACEWYGIQPLGELNTKEN
jgi:hypothetical protein